MKGKTMKSSNRMPTDEVLRSALMLYQALDFDMSERVHASVWGDVMEALESYGIEHCMPIPSPYSGLDSGVLCLTCGPAPELLLVTLRCGVPDAERVELHTLIAQA
jgi:hypothetical protein